MLCHHPKGKCPMSAIDKRGKLEDDVFSYQAAKDGRVMLSWLGKHIKTLAGKDAEKFLARIDGLDGAEAQLVLAKATGNFKRGNEKNGRG